MPMTHSQISTNSIKIPFCWAVIGLFLGALLFSTAPLEAAPKKSFVCDLHAKSCRKPDARTTSWNSKKATRALSSATQMSLQSAFIRLANITPHCRGPKDPLIIVGSATSWPVTLLTKPERCVS